MRTNNYFLIKLNRKNIISALFFLSFIVIVFLFIMQKKELTQLKSSLITQVVKNSLLESRVNNLEIEINDLKNLADDFESKINDFESKINDLEYKTDNLDRNNQGYYYY